MKRGDPDYRPIYSEVVIDDFEIESVITLCSGVDSEVLKEYSEAQGGIPIKVQGYNNKLMTMEEYQNLTNQYKSINQNANSVSQNARETYLYAQEKENAIIKLAKYLGLDYASSGIDRTHISTIINQLENKSETMIQGMYKVTDSEKLEDTRRGVEGIEDLVSQACETTKNTYTEELQDEFISSYEAKIQQLITDSKIQKLYFEQLELSSQRVSIIGKLLGKEKLREAMLDNLNKKMELQELRTYARGFRDFSGTEEKGIMTPEIEKFIKLLESKPELSDMAKKAKEIFERVIEQENQNTQLVPQSSKLSVRKQLKSVEQENEMLSNEIRDIKVQDTERKRGDVAKKICNTRSDALTQFEMILQSAEKALHIENDRENDKVMQEDLIR